MSTIWNTQFSYLSPSSNTTSSEKPFMVSEETFFLWASITQLPSSRLYILEPPATGSTCPAAICVLRCLIFFPIQGPFLKYLFFLMYVSFPNCVDFSDYGEPGEMIYFILLGERTEAFCKTAQLPWREFDYSVKIPVRDSFRRDFCLWFTTRGHIKICKTWFFFRYTFLNDIKKISGTFLLVFSNLKLG